MCNENEQTMYQEVIGSLLYILRCTRPDISTAVNILSQFTAKPRSKCIEAVQQIVSYLNGTADTKLLLKPDTHEEIKVYCDADWATSKMDRKSVSGYTVFARDSLVVWHSRRQKCIALSTMEAEMIAMCKGIKLVS